MSKNTRNRILLTAVAALLLACVAVGGTIAYLTAKSTEVTNTFETTTIDIKLEEHKLVENEDTGKLELSDEVVTENTNYLLQPGLTMPKDPFATVTAGDCYVFIEIVPNDSTDEDGVKTSEYISWTVKAMWDEVAGATGPNGGKVYGYKGTADATTLAVVAENVPTASIIDEITVSAALTNSDLTEDKAGQVKLTFYAYAIQSANIAADTAENIWALYARDDEVDATTYTAQ